MSDEQAAETYPKSALHIRRRGRKKAGPKETRTGQGRFRAVKVGEADMPGPRLKRKAAETIEAKAWTINCQGRAGAQAVLEAAASAGIDIVALQEVQMTKQDEKKFATSAALKGFRCYHQESLPGDQRSEKNKGVIMGGVIMLVATSIPSKQAAACFGTGGQAIFVWAAGCVVASIYAAHDPQRCVFQTKVIQTVQALAPRSKWALLGDYNEEPWKSPMVRTLELLGGSDRAPKHPTRWEGKRIIDYCISNLEDSALQWSLLPDRVADHRIVRGDIKLKGNRCREFQLVKTADLSKPPGITIENGRGQCRKSGKMSLTLNCISETRKNLMVRFSQ